MAAIGPKMVDGVPLGVWALNKFFDPRGRLIRIGCDGKEKKSGEK